jgi:hypothetical protein
MRIVSAYSLNSPVVLMETLCVVSAIYFDLNVDEEFRLCGKLRGIEVL